MNSLGAVSYVLVASAPFRGAKPSAALLRPSARTALAGFRNRVKVLCPALIFRKETEKKTQDQTFTLTLCTVTGLYRHLERGRQRPTTRQH